MRPFLSTSVGQKVAVSVTGIMLYGFVILHMLGNLKSFAGYDATTGIHKLDLYAHFLREMGAVMMGHSTVLWLTRIGLLGALLVHLYFVIKLTIQNRRARPIGYKLQNYQSTTFASSSMVYSGFLLLAFIIYHILHLTTGTVHGQFVEGRVFDNIVFSFSNTTTVFIYVASVALLGLHLYHGVWSLFQTLGLNNTYYNKHFKFLATFSSIVIFLGFASVPLAIYLSFIGK